jgi:low temperature requirement protein LtrA
VRARLGATLAFGRPDESVMRVSDRDPETETKTEYGRHATNLELFLDLVFVFAVTQIAGFLASHLTLAGFARGLLLAWLVWWLWSQFTWLGTAIDLGGRSTAQVLVLLAVPPTLLMAVALPQAFGDAGVEFGAAYLVVNLWALFIQGRGLWADPATRSAWLRYSPLAALTPCVLFAGAFLSEGPRTAVWGAVAVFSVASALMGAQRGEWRIDPVHFSERHALFVIISLGEVLVAVGTATAGVELTSEVGAALLAAVAVACVLWWGYFAYVPAVGERNLVRAPSALRGRVARDFFTFGHFPVVFGIVLYAVTAEHVAAHPTASLGNGDLAALAASVAFFVGGLLGLQWQTVRALAPERFAAIVVVAALCGTLGPEVSGTVLVALVALLLAITQVVTLRRFDRWQADPARGDGVAGPS